MTKVLAKLPEGIPEKSKIFLMRGLPGVDKRQEVDQFLKRNGSDRPLNRWVGETTENSGCIQDPDDGDRYTFVWRLMSIDEYSDKKTPMSHLHASFAIYLQGRAYSEGWDDRDYGVCGGTLDTSMIFVDAPFITQDEMCFFIEANKWGDTETNPPSWPELVIVDLYDGGFTDQRLAEADKLKRSVEEIAQMRARYER